MSSLTPPLATRPGWKKRIADHLEDALGYEVATFYPVPSRSASGRLLSTLSGFGVGGGRSLVACPFLWPSRSARKRSGTSPRCGPMWMSSGPTDAKIYWLCRTRITETKVSGPQLNQATGGASTTARNVNTLRRLVLKYETQLA